MGLKKKDMDLHEKSYIELQRLFNTTLQNWQENNLQIKRVREKECVKYSDFVANRAELRRLAKENAKLHSFIVRVDLEMQIRKWTGKND